MRFELAEAGSPTITVHDAAGRIIRRVDLGVTSSGRHGWQWDGTGDNGRPLPSGVYLVRMTVGAFVGHSRIILTR